MHLRVHLRVQAAGGAEGKVGTASSLLGQAWHSLPLGGGMRARARSRVLTGGAKVSKGFQRF